MFAIKILVALISMFIYGVMLTYEPKTKAEWIMYVLCVPATAFALFGAVLFVMTA